MAILSLLCLGNLGQGCFGVESSPLLGVVFFQMKFACVLLAASLLKMAIPSLAAPRVLRHSWRAGGALMALSLALQITLHLWDVHRAPPAQRELLSMALCAVALALLLAVCRRVMRIAFAPAVSGINPWL